MHGDDGIGEAMALSYAREAGEEALRRGMERQRALEGLEAVVGDLISRVRLLEQRLSQLDGGSR